MRTLERRSFLSLISNAVVGSTLYPAFGLAQQNKPITNGTCWLDVCAPFIIQDSALGIDSEIVLTADNFVGASGYSDGADGTEYQIYLYDFEGKPVGANGVAKTLSAKAMRTTVIPVSDLVGPQKSFWGGMKVRLRPKTRCSYSPHPEPRGRFCGPCWKRIGCPICAVSEIAASGVSSSL